MSNLGFCHTVHMALKLKEGGAATLAPVCSNWVFLNRGTSGRSVHNPLGNEKYAYIRNANEMISRVCIIAWILIARGSSCGFPCLTR